MATTTRKRGATSPFYDRFQHRIGRWGWRVVFDRSTDGRMVEAWDLSTADAAKLHAPAYLPPPVYPDALDAIVILVERGTFEATTTAQGTRHLAWVDDDDADTWRGVPAIDGSRITWERITPGLIAPDPEPADAPTLFDLEDQ